MGWNFLLQTHFDLVKNQASLGAPAANESGASVEPASHSWILELQLLCLSEADDSMRRPFGKTHRQPRASRDVGGPEFFSCFSSRLSLSALCCGSESLRHVRHEERGCVVLACDCFACLTARWIVFIILDSI